MSTYSIIRIHYHRLQIWTLFEPTHDISMNILLEDLPAKKQCLQKISAVKYSAEKHSAEKHITKKTARQNKHT